MKKEEEKAKDTELAPANSEQVTITATMIDNEDNGPQAVKKDLTAIIPDSSEVKQSANSSIVLESKEKELKTDGAVIIGTVSGEDIIIDDKATFPNQIDIEARKNAKIKAIKTKKKKKIKNEETDEVKKSQNITSIIALIVIIGLGGFAYYFFNHKTPEDFQPLHVYIELGDKMPIRIREYVKPGVGDHVDELEYALDTKDVILDEVGDYPFSVTFRNITKNGTISIQDTTKPDLKVKEVIITEGTAYSAETFVDTCIDLSGCNYSFENPNTVKDYQFAGKYEVRIVAVDAYGNKTTKTASLLIEAQGMVKLYSKEEEYDSEKGYSKKSTYDLHFTNFMEDAILSRGYLTEVYTYQDDSKFKTDSEKLNGEKGYSIDNANKTITYKSDSINVVNNYSRFGDIISSLEEEGFVEQ